MLAWLQNIWQTLSDTIITAFPLINLLLMVIAGCLGSMLVGKIKEPVRDTLLRALGLLVILMGGVELWSGFFVLQTGQFETTGTLLVIFALLGGYVIGHALEMDRTLGRLGNRLFRRFFKKKARPASPARKNGPEPSAVTPPRESVPSAEGFMLASVICAFSSTTMYSVLEGQLVEDALPLLVRLGFHAVVFFLLAALFGSGITLAAIPVFAVQGVLLLAGAVCGDLITNTLMNQFRLIGAVLLLATGIALGIGKRVRAAKLIPAYLIPVVYGGVYKLVMLFAEKMMAV